MEKFYVFNIFETKNGHFFVDLCVDILVKNLFYLFLYLYNDFIFALFITLYMSLQYSRWIVHLLLFNILILCKKVLKKKEKVIFFRWHRLTVISLRRETGKHGERNFNFFVRLLLCASKDIRDSYVGISCRQGNIFKCLRTTKVNCSDRNGDGNKE